MRPRRSGFPWSPRRWCAVLLLVSGCRGAEEPDGGALGVRAAHRLVASAPAAVPEGPAPGKYVCWIRGPASAGAGWFRLLPEGRYQPVSGPGGRYSYDAETRTLSFREGTFASYDWVGVHLVGDGAESSDGETVVLKDRTDARAPGAEGAGEFQYCYRSTHPDDQ